MFCGVPWTVIYWFLVVYEGGLLCFNILKYAIFLDLLSSCKNSFHVENYMHALLNIMSHAREAWVCLLDWIIGSIGSKIDILLTNIYEKGCHSLIGYLIAAPDHSPLSGWHTSDIEFEISHIFPPHCSSVAAYFHAWHEIRGYNLGRGVYIGVYHPGVGGLYLGSRGLPFGSMEWFRSTPWG